MDSKRITISVPAAMLRRIDEAAAISYQTRSNFIRLAIVEKFGAKSQLELRTERAPHMRSDKQLSNMYDFPEEYDDYLTGNG
jgi:metal-responsive CopG/Arc/MetJ family transcriptional regulator